MTGFRIEKSAYGSRRWRVVDQDGRTVRVWQPPDAVGATIAPCCFKTRKEAVAALRGMNALPCTGDRPVAPTADLTADYNAERFGKALNTVGAADLSRLQNQFALISNSATQLRDAL